jgi:hypothetical protein
MNLVGRRVPAARGSLAPEIAVMKPTLPASDPRIADASPERKETSAAPPAVAQVLALIRADSQQQAREYLRDTVVPCGGE